MFHVAMSHEYVYYPSYYLFIYIPSTSLAIELSEKYYSSVVAQANASKGATFPPKVVLGASYDFLRVTQGLGGFE